MDRGRFNRTSAIGVAAAIHILLLGALALGIPRSGPANTPDQLAIQVTLEQRPKAPPPKPELKPPAKKREAVAAAAPQAASAAPIVHTAPSANPSVPDIDAGEKAAMGDVVRALRGSFGCAHPDAVGLNDAEKVACKRQFRAGDDPTKPLYGLTEEKRNRFDRAVRCRQTYYDAPVPAANSASNGLFPGLGFVPRIRDCPPSDQ